MAQDAEWNLWWERVGDDGLNLILWAAWDPIGGSPWREYDQYAPQIAALLRGKAKPEEVAATLGQIRTETIGLEPDPASDLQVAEKLRDWYEFYDLSEPAELES